MKIRIITGSRLHLGFYNISNNITRFGSLGLYVNEPQTIIETNGETRESYIIEIKKKICGIEKTPDPIIKKYIPRHVGLGSTTQLYMAIARYYSITCRKKYSIKKLASITRRGEISGIGIHGFNKGGFIIDAGKPVNQPDRIPDLLFRIPFPRQWRIIIAIPYGKKGYSEEEERILLSKNIETDEKLEKELKNTLLSKVIPGLITSNIREFGSGIKRIQTIIGKIFSPYQEGIYSTSETEKLIEILESSGATGTGQSSWGPLAYGFLHKKELKTTIKQLEKHLYKENIQADILITTARNKGHVVQYLQ